MADFTQPVPYERITILRESLVDGLTTTTVFDKARMTITQEEPEPPMLSIIDATKVPAVPPPPTVQIEIKPERNEDGIWVHSHSSAAFVLPDGDERP